MEKPPILFYFKYGGKAPLGFKYSNKRDTKDNIILTSAFL